MKASAHALSGAAAWLAAAPALGAALDVAVDGPTLAAGTVVTAGAALLPDLDHPRASVSRALGPLTGLLAVAVHAAAGGHRAATHSLAFVAGVGAVTWAGLQLPFARGVGIGVAAVCVGLALRAVGPKGVRHRGLLDATMLVWTVGLTAWGAVTVDSVAWLAPALTGGVLLHVAGDAITPAGVPLLWPRRPRYALALLPRSGGLLEPAVTVALGLAVVLLAWVRVVPLI